LLLTIAGDSITRWWRVKSHQAIGSEHRGRLAAVSQSQQSKITLGSCAAVPAAGGVEGGPAETRHPQST